MPDPAFLALAFLAGIAGGGMNALAGGGTFATMPTLIALGLPGPIANATSNVSLQPGAIASAWGFRRTLAPVGGLSVRLLVAITFTGGIVGALLLVATPTRVFDLLIPWLLLVATIALAFGPAASGALRRHVAIGRRSLIAAQVLLGIYGGYFGGGVGLMMTATWGLMVGDAPHKLMGARTLMLAMANAAAMIVFVASGMVGWALCLPMLCGAIIGGVYGAKLGLRLSPAIIRGWTVLMTAVTTAAFFWRAYG